MLPHIAAPVTSVKPGPLWRGHFLLISHVMWNSISSLIQVSAASKEETSKDATAEEKIKTGNLLLENLDEILEDIKGLIKAGKEADSDIVQKLTAVKIKFNKLKMQSGDLPEDMLQNFKKKAANSLKLIMETFVASSAVKSKANKEEIVAEPTTSSPTTLKPTKKVVAKKKIIKKDAKSKNITNKQEL